MYNFPFKLKLSNWTLSQKLKFQRLRQDGTLWSERNLRPTGAVHQLLDAVI
ncbi:MAG: hypothetical protein VX541_05465 [Candidatus Poribacteria bacterium]|nr:hypothetical protein [Candidatus Poribacteria bacterium]